MALSAAQKPSHTHNLNASTCAGISQTVGGNVLAGGNGTFVYAPPSTAPVATNQAALADAGNGALHDNMQPFLTVNYCIATRGVFPPRN